MIFSSYLVAGVQVYEKAGLLGARTVLAHCVHLTDQEVQVVALLQ